MTADPLAIALGAVASVLVVGLSLAVRRRTIALATVLLGVVWIAQYAVLGRWGTVALGTITALYSAATLADRRGGRREPEVLAGVAAVYGMVFFLVQTGSGAGVWSIDLLALAASLLGIWAVAEDRPLRAKLVLLAAGLIWGAFHALAGAWGQLPGEAFYLAGALVSLAAIWRSKRAGIPDADIPELPELIRRRMRR